MHICIPYIWFEIEILREINVVMQLRQITCDCRSLSPAPNTEWRLPILWYIRYEVTS